jgi:hypothetical protein
MKNQHLIDNLSTAEKVDLFQHLYAELAGHGTDGDTELAHVNRFEAQVLRNIGGSGTVNKVTGLRQFGKGGGGPTVAPAQSTQTVQQVPEYAPEQREYIRDIFGKAQELYEQRSAEGFQPFPGPQLAPFSAQEKEAFAGIESLARGPGAAPAFEVARTAALGAAAPVTAGELQGLMNPYQQAVTDIAKREASRQYQSGPQQQMRSAATAEGGLRGARRFVEEAEGQRNLQQQMSDIQMMGSQQAYNQAMAEAAAARGRLANLAQQMPAIGTGAYQQQMAQLGQLGGVGEAQRAREQAAIDLAQQQFQQELKFPEETLATYLRFITNAPSPSGFQKTLTTPVVPGPSALQSLTSLAGQVGSIGQGFGLFNQGGSVGRQSGLSGIVRRSRGGQVVRLANGSVSPFARYAQRYPSGLELVKNAMNAMNRYGGSGASLVQDFTNVLDRNALSTSPKPFVPPIVEQTRAYNISSKLQDDPSMFESIIDGSRSGATPEDFGKEVGDASQYLRDMDKYGEVTPDMEGLSGSASKATAADFGAEFGDASRYLRDMDKYGEATADMDGLSGSASKATADDFGAEFGDASRYLMDMDKYGEVTPDMEGLGLPKAETRGGGAEKPKTAKEQAEDIVKKEEAKKTGLDRYDAEDWFRIAAAFGRAGQESTATGNVLGDISQMLSAPAGAFAEAEKRIKGAEKAKKAEEREERLTASSERRADIATRLAEEEGKRSQARLDEAIASGEFDRDMRRRGMTNEEAKTRFEQMRAQGVDEREVRRLELEFDRFENTKKLQAEELNISRDKLRLAERELGLSGDKLALEKQVYDREGLKWDVDKRIKDAQITKIEAEAQNISDPVLREAKIITSLSDAVKNMLLKTNEARAALEAYGIDPSKFKVDETGVPVSQRSPGSR